MKIDGDKFMKWLHKIREEAKRQGADYKRNRELEISRAIVKKYRIPIVKV